MGRQLKARWVGQLKVRWVGQLKARWVGQLKARWVGQLKVRWEWQHRLIFLRKERRVYPHVIVTILHEVKAESPTCTIKLRVL